MKCQECDTTIDEPDNFCRHCGVPLKAPPPPPAEEPEQSSSILPPAPKYDCPVCGTTLTYVEQYGSYWCDKCQNYPPPEAWSSQKGQALYICSECGSNVDYVEEHRQYWCHKCQKYVPPKYGDKLVEPESPPDAKPKKPQEDSDIDWEEDDQPTEEPAKTTKCPKCKAEIKINRSQDKKVRVECKSCGAKGKIPNPYLK